MESFRDFPVICSKERRLSYTVIAGPFLYVFFDKLCGAIIYLRRPSASLLWGQ